MALGVVPPISAEYPWAVVSNSLGSMLFVLARNVTEFVEKYEREVMDELRRRGLAGAERGSLVRTFQSQTECRYPSTPIADSKIDGEAGRVSLLTAPIRELRYDDSSIARTESTPNSEGIVCIRHRDGTESCRDTTDTPTNRKV